MGSLGSWTEPPMLSQNGATGTRIAQTALLVALPVMDRLTLRRATAVAMLSLRAPASVTNWPSDRPGGRSRNGRF